MTLEIRFVNKINEISVAQWQMLRPYSSPFLSYEFLSALEEYACVGEDTGWLPQHLLVERNSQLVAFMPLYIKFNSYGEFVFDWEWAGAYQRNGREYYPKLVSSIPYTPATDHRILIAANENPEPIYQLIAQYFKQLLPGSEFSGFHCLFLKDQEMTPFLQQGYVRRLGCQFHWKNQGYESFEHYLSFFVSRKRKNIKRERKSVSSGKFHFQILHGHEIEPDLWPLIYEFYRITFYKKSGYPTFTLEFFQKIGPLLKEKFLVNMVSFEGKFVACAIFYRDEKTLYGRHWGCFAEFQNLHFETCFYQGLDYAIAHNLQNFEPGAQGEHKISRGFLPTKTWSVHYLAEPVFQSAIEDFGRREEQYMAQYINDLGSESPFRSPEES